MPKQRAVIYTRAAVYARVSSDDTGKDGRNLAGQLTVCGEYARQQGYEIVAEFTEDERGVSGADPEPPGLKRVIELAQQGRFEVLIVREIDRLARNLAKQLHFESLLTEAGVKIEYALQRFEDNSSGRLSKNMIAAVAEFEREKIKERTARGKRIKVKAGHIITNKRPPYGFIGKTIDGKRTLVPVPDEARIIKLIFDWYVEERLSMRAIAGRLSKMNTPTYYDNRPHLISPNKKREPYSWSTAVVAQILSDTVYAGSWRYTSGNEIVTVPVEPIVSQELFAAAQKLRAKNKKLAPRNTRHPYLMRGHLKCTCGYSLQCKSKRWGDNKVKLYYRPIHAGVPDLAYVDCPVTRYFPAADVDGTVWLWLKNLMREPDYLPRLYAQHKSQQDRAIDDLREQLAVKENQLEQIKAGLSRLLTKMWSTPDEFPESQKILKQQQIELEDRVRELKNEIAGLNGLINTGRITDDDVATMAAFFTRISNALSNDNETFERRRHTIEMLDVTGVVYEVDGQIYIDIYSLFVAEKRVPVVSMASRNHRHNNNLIIFPIPADAL